MSQKEIYINQISKSIGVRTVAWKKCREIYLSIRERFSKQGVLDSSSVYTDLGESVLVLSYTLKKPYEEVLKIWDGVSKEVGNSLDMKTSYKVIVTMDSAE